MKFFKLFLISLLITGILTVAKATTITPPFSNYRFSQVASCNSITNGQRQDLCEQIDATIWGCLQATCTTNQWTQLGNGAWTQLGTNLYPTSINSNVGINTFTPTHQLDIQGNPENYQLRLKETGVSGGIQFQFTDPHNNPSGFTMYNDGSPGDNFVTGGYFNIVLNGSLTANTDAYSIPNQLWMDAGGGGMAIIADNSDATDNIDFRTAGVAGGNPPVRMRIDSNGNVGIGTTNFNEYFFTVSSSSSIGASAQFISTDPGGYSEIDFFNSLGDYSAIYMNPGASLDPTNLKNGYELYTDQNMFLDIANNTKAFSIIIDNTELFSTSLQTTTLSPPIDNNGEHSTQANIVQINDDDYSTGTYEMPLSAELICDNYDECTEYRGYELQAFNSSTGIPTTQTFNIQAYGGNTSVGNGTGSIQLDSSFFQLEANSGSINFINNGTNAITFQSGQEVLVFDNSNNNVYLEQKLSIGPDYFNNNPAPDNGIAVEGNVGIGTWLPAQALDVQGTAKMIGFQLPTGAGASKILQSNSVGIGTWVPASNVGAGITSVGTGLALSSGTLNSNAVYQVNYQPGLLTAVNATIGVYGKVSKTSTVDNIICSAVTFSCVANPTITMYECGTTAACNSTPTTIGTCTVTGAGTAIAGTVSNSAITAGDYIGWNMSAGTCASVDLAVTAQVHSN